MKVPWRMVGLAALFLVPRLLLIGDARWTSEESWFFSDIYATAHGQRWQALGTPVSGTHGHHPGPYFYWLLAPFAWGGWPWLVSIGVALLDSLGHLLALLGLRALWGQTNDRKNLAIGLAALVLALSPWALLYADRPWNSNLVSLPVGLALWGLGHWLQHGGLKPFLALTLGLAVLPSFHLSAPILGLPMLLLVGWRWRQLTARCILAAALLSACVWAPYLAHEWQHDGSNVKGLFKRSLPQVSGSANTQLAFSWPLRLVAPEIGYHAQKGYWSSYQPWAFLKPGHADAAAWHAIHGTWLLPGIFVGLLVALLAWGRWLATLRRSEARDAFAFLVLGGTLLGWVLLLAAGRRAYPHYLHPLLPLYAGVFGLGLVRWFEQPRWRLLISTMVTLHLVSGLVAVSRFQQQNDRPFGLRANLFTLDALQRFGGAQPRFCGALRYRSRQQLERIARVRHPEQRLLEGAMALVHVPKGAAAAKVKKHSVWQQEAHGVQHFLVDNALPGGWGRVGCH